MFERGNLSRRGFMNRSLAGLTAAGLPLWYAKEVHGADEATRAAKARKANANEKLNVGYVGIGSPQSRAYAMYGASKKFKQSVHNVAVCDVDAPHLARAVKDFKADGYEPKAYTDFRQLTDDPTVDAVVVATPDHWHALVAIDAMRKGKDVYCEKPLTLTIQEALALQKVAKETGKILQTGSQQRTEMRQFREAVEAVRAGRIGKVKRIECRIGAVDPSDAIPVTKVPEGLNWDMWQGPAPEREYRSNGTGGRYGKTNCHYEFRWWYEYSGGKMTDWGAHHLDIAQWALGMDGSGPVAVECIDAAPPKAPKGEGYNCHPTFKVKYTYADGAEVMAMDGRGTTVKGLVKRDGKPPTTRKRNRDKDGNPIEGYTETPVDGVDGGANGVMIFGETGTIFVDRGQLLASDAKVLEQPKLDTPLYPSRPTDHFGNFLDCVKTREKPICDPTVGGGSVIVCHLGVIALLSGVGSKYTWDPAKNEFTGANAEKGNKMKSREMRSPWKLDV